MSKKEEAKGITIKKSEDFSEWYTQIIQKAELADIRYNIKGFLVFQPWSVMSMEKMYHDLEKVLQRKGHRPYFYPTLIPESNLKKEASHLSGFTPEVFWVTQGGNKKFEEKYALRPTSETAFYQMFSLWIRGYRDLPLKTYQRANIFRYDTKATRPFLRSREFHWIETHCAFRSEEDAFNQVKEDMETTKEVLHDMWGLPFIFFERPAWDKFPGASRTFAADVLNPDGKVIQQPSTHMISPHFSKAFNIKFKDNDDKDKNAYLTCYGPAVSRIFASVIIIHGDDKGLRFPWEIAPLQVAIVPIKDDLMINKKVEAIKKKIEKVASVEIDYTEKSAGEKFNHWEMKGVPIRIDVGFNDIKNKKLTVFRRDTNQKQTISELSLMSYINKVSKECTKNLTKEADRLFENKIKDVKNVTELKSALDGGNIARCMFCSVDKEGTKCAEVVEKKFGAEVRGTRLDEKKVNLTNSKCVICGKNATAVVYVAKSY